jgi:hypothetical protein
MTEGNSKVTHFETEVVLPLFSIEYLFYDRYLENVHLQLRPILLKMENSISAQNADLPLNLTI